MKGSLMDDISIVVITVAIICHLLLEFDVNAKNNICQFLIFGCRCPNVRLNRFIMVLARKGVKRWYILGLVFGSGKPEPADSHVCVLDERLLQFERAILESGVKFFKELRIRDVEIEVSRVDTIRLSAIEQKVNAASRRGDRFWGWSWRRSARDVILSVRAIRVNRWSN